VSTLALSPSQPKPHNPCQARQDLNRLTDPSTSRKLVLEPMRCSQACSLLKPEGEPRFGDYPRGFSFSCPLTIQLSALVVSLRFVRGTTNQGSTLWCESALPAETLGPALTHPLHRLSTTIPATQLYHECGFPSSMGPQKSSSDPSLPRYTEQKITYPPFHIPSRPRARVQDAQAASFGRSSQR
jgi:hypothetical protein